MNCKSGTTDCMPRGVRFFVLACVALSSSFIYGARRTAAVAAETAVQWLARGKAPHGPVYRGVQRTRTFEMSAGGAFHCVDFTGGGFAVVPADDDSADVVCYSASETCDLFDPASPLRGILEARRACFAARSAVSFGSGVAALQNASFASTSSSSLSTVADVRVDALVQSKWNQTTDGSGRLLYNYYTPNNVCCGCVATAMAQLMRFHQYPTASISSFTRTCTLEGSSVSLTAKGGTYDWASMPYDPKYGATDTQREAIGKICYDAGVSVKMQYSEEGSGTYLSLVPDSLKNIFKYANARGCFSYSSGMTLDQIKRAVLPNLDAGYPVLFSIVTTSNVGHAIVGDGYGYSDDALYVHLNMGWSGYCDLWYALPTVEAGGYTFSLVSGVVYNVYPSGTGDILSGRVVDDAGEPVSGATVTLEKATVTQSGGGRGGWGWPGGWNPVTYTTNWTTATTLTTDARGVYLSRSLTSGVTYRAQATKDSVSSTTSVQGTLVASGSYSSTAGNLQMADLVVPVPDPVTETQTTEVPVSYDWLETYYPDAQTADYESLAAQTGANGRSVWESYLLGLDPTNETSDLLADIQIVNGFPVVQWNVTSDVARVNGYVYKVEGKQKVSDTTWAETNATHRFFRVHVTK